MLLPSFVVNGTGGERRTFVTPSQQDALHNPSTADTYIHLYINIYIHVRTYTHTHNDTKKLASTKIELGTGVFLFVLGKMPGKLGRTEGRTNNVSLPRQVKTVEACWLLYFDE